MKCEMQKSVNNCKHEKAVCSKYGLPKIELQPLSSDFDYLFHCFACVHILTIQVLC